MRDEGDSRTAMSSVWPVAKESSGFRVYTV